MEFKVFETQQFGDLLLVIYDWMEFPDSKSVRNLYAYDSAGERLWIAQTRRVGDFFTGFVGDGKFLRVATWDCFCCTIDPKTGDIVDSVFTK